MQLPIEYLTSATIISALLLLCLTLYYLYSFHKRESELANHQDNVNRHSQDLIMQAQVKAQTIVEQATSRANHLLLEAGTTQKQMQEAFDKALSDLLSLHEKRLQEAMDRFEESQKTALDDLYKKYHEQIQKTVEDIGHTTQTELADFINALRKETVEAQRIVGNTLNSELSTIQEEIERYKKDQFQKTNEAINKTVLQIAQNVLGKSIQIKDHERLVIEALKEAQEKGVFNNG